MTVIQPLSALTPLLESNAMLLSIIRKSCPGICGSHATLEQFASHVLRDGSPPELAVFILCICKTLPSDDIERHLALIDQYIISDDEYLGSLEGLECALLQSMTYTDIGQLRRGWLTNRRGLVFAQLMGLHRTHSLSPQRESIWWSLFQIDRFVSMLLGLPYGIADAHCDMRLNGKALSSNFSPATFLVECASIAGKIIDRIQGVCEQSYSSTLDTDQHLDNLAREAPTSWWNVPSLPAPDDPVSALEWQEAILAQMCFHQNRAYLHMPFMLQSTTNPRYEYSRTACLGGAREMLRLYHLLRDRDTPLYDCKAFDFIAFTAAILLALDLLGYGHRTAASKSQQDVNDWALIDKTMELLWRASLKKGGNVAAQSYQTLEFNFHVRDRDYLETDVDPKKVVIPYFGTISLRRASRLHDQNSASTSSGVTPGVTQGIVTPADINGKCCRHQVDTVITTRSSLTMASICQTPLTTSSSRASFHGRTTPSPTVGL